jgi:hypothetical protein
MLFFVVVVAFVIITPLEMLFDIKREFPVAKLREVAWF